MECAIRHLRAKDLRALGVGGRRGVSVCLSVWCTGAGAPRSGGEGRGGRAAPAPSLAPPPRPLHAFVAPPPAPLFALTRAAFVASRPSPHPPDPSA